MKTQTQIDEYRAAMEQEIRNRKIRSMYHFTDIRNLPSILTRGLLPRTKLNDGHMNFQANDSQRLDGCQDAVCTTISHTNGKMLYRLLRNTLNHYAVIELIPEQVLTRDCGFCPTNAACSYMNGRNRKGIDCFRAMFSGPNACFPRDEQAEILVFETIPVSAIRAIHFQWDKDRRAFSKYAPEGVSCDCEKSYLFSTRGYVYSGVCF